MSKLHRTPGSEQLLRALEISGLLDAGAVAFLLQHQPLASDALDRGETAALQTFLRAIALGLGACPECWGQRLACPLCHGLGKPGLFLPEPRHFEALIGPAVAARRDAEDAQNRPDETVRARMGGDDMIT